MEAPKKGLRRSAANGCALPDAAESAGHAMRPSRVAFWLCTAH